MPPRRRRHVDPARVHLISLVVFGVIAGAALAVWTFPKFFGGLLLLALSALLYSKIYAFIEDRLEAEEGRLAEELGFDLEEDDDDLDADEEPIEKPRRRRKARAKGAPAAAAAGTDAGNGSPAPRPTEPPPGDPVIPPGVPPTAE